LVSGLRELEDNTVLLAQGCGEAIKWAQGHVKCFVSAHPPHSSQKISDTPLSCMGHRRVGITAIKGGRNFSVTADTEGSLHAIKY